MTDINKAVGMAQQHGLHGTARLIQEQDKEITRLRAKVAKADALANKGNALALRLTHIVGKEHIVTAWETAEAAYREGSE